MTTVTISLPDQVAKKVDLETKRLGFATRSEFIRSLLRGFFAKEEGLELKEFEPVPLKQLKLELLKTGKYNEKFINSVIEGFKKYRNFRTQAS